MDAVVVSDGKKGHVNQSLAFAELLGARNVRVLTIKKNSLTPDFFIRLFSGLISPRNYPASWRRRALKHYFGDEAVASSFTPGSVVISAGTLTAAPTLALAGELHSACMHILNPSLVPLRCFDAVVLPQHDLAGKIAPNVVLLPVALGPVGGKSLDDSFAELQRRLGNGKMPQEDCIAVLIGGESAHYHMAEDAVLPQVAKLAAFAEAYSLKLVLTTSRRTSEAIEDALIKLAQEHPGAFTICVWGRTDPYNPIPAFLELARAVVVTEESISMVSEAFLGGHYPFIMPLQMRKNVPKFARFYRYLYAHGYAQHLPLDGLDALVKSSRRSREEVSQSIGLPHVVGLLRHYLKLEDA